MSTIALYVLLKMDAIGCVFGAFAFLFGMFAFGIAVAHIPAQDNPELWIKVRRFARCHWPWSITLSILCAIANALLPSTKEMAVLLIAPRIINNAQVQELPQRVLTLATEWMEELRPAKLKDEVKHEEK